MNAKVVTAEIFIIEIAPGSHIVSQIFQIQNGYHLPPVPTVSQRISLLKGKSWLRPPSIPTLSLRSSILKYLCCKRTINWGDFSVNARFSHGWLSALVDPVTRAIGKSQRLERRWVQVPGSTTRTHLYMPFASMESIHPRAVCMFYLHRDIAPSNDLKFPKESLLVERRSVVETCPFGNPVVDRFCESYLDQSSVRMKIDE